MHTISHYLNASLLILFRLNVKMETFYREDDKILVGTRRTDYNLKGNVMLMLPRKLRVTASVCIKVSYWDARPCMT